MAIVGSNSVTGVTTAASGTDAVYRGYLDDRGQIPPVAGNVNEYLTTNGSSLSWEQLGGYTEYTSSGTFTYTIPTAAKFLTVHAIGAGGGGAAGNVDGTSWANSNLALWYVRTTGMAVSAGIKALTLVSSNIFAGATQGQLSYSTNGIIWVAATPSFGSNTIDTIEFLNSLYVAGGQNGTFNTSTNSISWTIRTASFATNEIFTTAFGAGVYVAAGAAGRLNTSTDAINWTLRTGAFAANQINMVRFISPNFLGVSNAGFYNASTDGINWTLRTASFQGAFNIIKNIIFANSLYLKCGQSGKLNTSTNAIQWTLRTSGTTQQINGIAYSTGNNAYFCGTANGQIFVSTNAIEWTLRTSGSASQINVCLSATSIADLNGHDNQGLTMTPINPSGLSGGGGGSGAYAAWQIPRGLISGSTITVNVGSAGTGGVAGGAAAVAGNNTVINWIGAPGSTTYTLSVGGGGAGSNTIGGRGGVFISQNQNYYRFATGSRGGNGTPTPYVGESAPQATTAFQSTGGGGGGHARVDVSPNATGVVGGGGGGMWYNGALNNQQFATDAIEVNATSPRRLTGAMAASGPSGAGVEVGSVPGIWTLRTNPSASTFNNVRFNFYNNLFLSTSYDGIFSHSTDAVVWTIRTAAAGMFPIDSAFGNSTYVLLGATGAVRTSTDIITWTFRTSGLTGTYRSLAFGSGVFVAASESVAGLASSTDAISWTLRTNGTPTPGQSVNRARYLNGNFFLTGWTCLYSVSTDAINWTTRTLPGSNQNVNDFTYTNSVYVAAYDTRIATSTNAIQWTFRTHPFDVDSPVAISANNNISTVLASSNNKLAVSTDTIIWQLKSPVSTSAYKTTAAGNNIVIYGGEYSSRVNVVYATLSLPVRGTPQNGVMGSGGSGGAYDGTADLAGNGGNGSPGYVRIEWR